MFTLSLNGPRFGIRALFLAFFVLIVFVDDETFANLYKTKCQM
jgi:hypothetical protein